jgi:ankyrin repeat protein
MIMKKAIVVALVLVLLSLQVFAQEKDVFDVIKKGTVKDLKILLESNPGFVKALDSENTLPLQLAVRLKNNKMAKLLVKHGADPTANSGKWGTNAIFDALQRDNEEILKWFFRNGIDINYVLVQEYEGNTYSSPFLLSAFRNGIA